LDWYGSGIRLKLDYTWTDINWYWTAWD
jgi:hypothetical protein